MAVQEQTPLREYTANGVTTSFALGFDCEETNHLIVTIDDVEVLPTDWYLSGSNVVFWTAPGNGKLIKLQRNTPFNRLVDYQSYNNSFRPPAINKEFDRIWWKLQELGVADWILHNRIDALKAYVDQQDSELQQNIDNLKIYVDDKDDELRAYLLAEIQKQGVALDQLDEYYNYLMQRLAQIAIDKGWEASFVVSAGGDNQQEINDRGGSYWREKPLGYDINSRVMLENGDIVRSTVDGNTVDPNVDMTGWVKVNSASQIFDESGNTQQDINNQIKTPLSVNADDTGSIDVTSQLASLLDPAGKHVIQLTKGVYLTDGITIPPNTIVYANGAIFKRKSHSGRPVVTVGENSVLVSARVDGNKDVLGLGALPNRGIDLRRNSYIIFCESYGNARHGVYAMNEDLMVFDPPSENQKALFCKSYDNGFDPGGGGTADGFSAMNSDNVLFFGCEAWGNARTGFVATTYDRNTQQIDPSYSRRVQTQHCRAWDNGYSDFNFEGVTQPEVSNIQGGGVTFSKSPNTIVSDISEISSIYAEDADFAQISGVTIKNDVRSHSLLYLRGRNPKVNNITAIVGESVPLTSNTIEIQDVISNLGDVSNISVNRALNGVILRVANASNINVQSATNVWYRIIRSEGFTQFSNFKSFVNSKLEVYSSAIPTSGAWNKNDMVWNTFFSATSKTMAWICTTSGVFGATPPVFEAVTIMSRGVAVPNAAGANPTKAEFDALLTSLRNSGQLST